MEPEEAIISRRVRGQLGENQVSGAELARRIGATQSYVSRRLRGAVPWRASDLRRIAAALDVPVEQFLRAPERAA